MKIVKSSRHQKVIGDFGEQLICNWLSRSGFEVAHVDHTGIDIVAFNPSMNARLGITVKSRTRTPGKEAESVNIFRQKDKNDRETLVQACIAFACEPWIAVYIETTEFGEVYLTSLETYDTKYRGKEGRAIETWKMRPEDKEDYAKNPDVKHIRIDFYATNWVWQR